MSRGQKLRFEREKKLGIKNKGAVAVKKKRDQKCIELAPYFFHFARISPEKLSEILFKNGYSSRNGTPYSRPTLIRYKRRIAEMIEEGLLDQPEP